MNARYGLLSLALCTSLFSPSPAEAARDQGFTMEVLVSGHRTQEYAARGKTYIEAKAGHEYTIRLTNPTPRRVGVALSVDGLNSIDAKHTTAEAAAKWVIAPHSSLMVHGWQISGEASRAFYFTNEAGSYGEWLGDTDNLGIISAVFFEEELPVVMPMPYLRGERESKANSGRGQGAKADSLGAKNKRVAPSASSGLMAPMEESADEGYAATGIGRETYNPVNRVRMELQDRPSASINIRYEFRDDLIDLGIYPIPDRVYRDRARGFESSSFAPDPYRR